jgi:hypothetical protein
LALVSTLEVKSAKSLYKPVALESSVASAPILVSKSSTRLTTSSMLLEPTSTNSPLAF